MYLPIYTILFLTGLVTPKLSIAHGRPPSKDASFSPNFGVYFHPPLVKPNTPYTKSYKDIIPYLELVRSQFSVITLDSYSKVSVESSFTEIYTPSAVAQLNKQEENLAISSKKMQVYLNYYMNPHFEFEAAHRENFKLNFDYTKQIADQANQIYSGTVKHITMDLYRQGLSNVDGIIEQLMHARNETANGEWKYKLGVALSIDRCLELSSVLGDSVWRLLSLVDFCVFSLLPTGSKLEDNYPCLQRKLDKCKRTLEKTQGAVELAVWTMWPGENDRELISYWRWMNNWVKDSNWTVFMSDAFDTPGRAPHLTLFNSLGWWHVDHESKMPNRSLIVTEKVKKLSAEEVIQTSFDSKECLKSLESLEADHLETLECPKKISFARPKVKNALAGQADSSVELQFKHSRFIVYFFTHFQRLELGNVFNEEELIPLLELARTRFSNIIVSPLSLIAASYGSSAVYVPTAVAKLNKKHFSNNNSSDHLRVWLVYDQLNLNRNRVARLTKRSSFDFNMQLADQANSIFNGTVEYIVLWTYSVRDIEDAIHQLEYSAWRIAQRSEKENSYKYGIILDFNLCGGSSPNVLSHLKYLFKFVSFVVFETPSQLADLTVHIADVESYILKEYQVGLEFCLRKMKKSYPKIEVMFSSFWPDTDITGKTNMSQLTFVWESMNQWAKRTNTTVLMYEAFDNLARSTKISPQTSFGWWRFKEGCPCATSTTEYRFEEKRVLGLCSSGSPLPPRNSSIEVRGNKYTGGFSFNQLTYKGAYDTTPQFNRDRFVIFYDSMDDLQGVNLIVNDVLGNAIIRMVHTRFSKIILKPIQEGNLIYKELYTFIPKSAANFNRLQELSGEKIVKNEVVRVILTFDLEWLPLLQEREGTKIRTSFDVALQLANEANGIYPGTVEHLLLQYNELNEDNMGHVTEQLKQFQRQADSAFFPYQIGIFLSRDDCRFSEEELEDSYIWTILPHVKVVIFTFWTTPNDWDVGAEETFKTITEDFRVCQQKVRKKFTDLEMWLYTSWTDTNENGKQNLTALLKFWGEMNEFSRNANTTVILNKAFDSTDKLTKHKHYRGWWKMIGEKSKTIPPPASGDQKIPVFEEKYQIVRARNETLCWKLFNNGKNGNDRNNLSGNSGARNYYECVLWSQLILGLILVVVTQFS